MNGNDRTLFIRALTFTVIVLNVTGNYFLDLGMRHVGAIVSVSPFDYVKAFANAWVILGVVVLAGWMICQLSLLSWADLTYVLPITSVSYVFLTILGAVGLNERVSISRWAGVALIVTGVAIVGRTRASTSPEDREEQP